MNFEELLKSLGLTDEQVKTVISSAPKSDELTAEIERLRKHNETLLSEKKAETEKRKAEQAEKDKQAEELARKKGDYETLENGYKGAWGIWQF